MNIDMIEIFEFLVYKNQKQKDKQLMQGGVSGLLVFCVKFHEDLVSPEKSQSWKTRHSRPTLRGRPTCARRAQGEGGFDPAAEDPVGSFLD